MTTNVWLWQVSKFRLEKWSRLIQLVVQARFTQYSAEKQKDHADID